MEFCEGIQVLPHRELDRVFITKTNLAVYKIIAIYSDSIAKRIYPTYGQIEDFFLSNLVVYSASIDS
jgi:hypothetical protein